MRVSILGAGAIAYGLAAYLAQSGHSPTLWSPSGRRTRTLATGELLKATGDIEATVPVRIAKDCRDAIDHADVVVIALPAYGHKMVMDAAVPHLADGIPVIISSHSSFGALYLWKRLAERKIRLPIVVWGTTLLTGRQLGSSEVNVTSIRRKLDVATLPFDALDQGYELCTALFGDRFVKRDGLLAIALSNLNPQNHLGIALLNLTRMEKAEQWSQGGNVTPAVGRLIEALDAERLAIAAHFGIAVRTVQEHFSLSFHVPMSTVSEMNQEMDRQGRGGFGPTTIESRYILEDVPFGLLPTAVLGKISGNPATLHESGISILSAAYGRDLKGDNDILPALGIEKMTKTDLEALCRKGF
ncbi:NAD/NADP octopine/nopaline dehydrogenase family protein [Mesorhizobium sp. C416B]|uniref:NAD/NADP octopine/nopaline dehydrogenase family protein n=1 Tax=unclassified Mesorhizobium TaxID=325217 RepID=UPI0003CE5E21|nr:MULTISPECIES: NAD/NADP octopine/nopaline dehydrogenase family protein [unclassified Mesorhizobium]ESX49065.1 NAD/NADP octopine/nopaline dehydrogenase [Mesorhizobium sp. LSHC426A00]ESX56173.1 NAD/NADP octopine/nopaline dehydrogenase [Mesorhizobium sp. LSHC424B00]ESX73017.1 NAD/NADP octopine/nopaline dehydrogenase [Mesorhizobium sp. LSHC416B00]ESZ41607.1 NAD/NADP octopine/nopaline dehydrogenase [Mesorhizobium sp. L2C066B000]WJI61974.1 NAD/NADP octopine/nopaline dehydrogenase family protein [M